MYSKFPFLAIFKFPGFFLQLFEFSKPFNLRIPGFLDIFRYSLISWSLQFFKLFFSRFYLYIVQRCRNVYLIYSIFLALSLELFRFRRSFRGIYKLTTFGDSQLLPYTGCERYWRPFFDTNINLHKTFKNNYRLMKLSGIVYLYLDFTFSRWNRL